MIGNIKDKSPVTINEVVNLPFLVPIENNDGVWDSDVPRPQLKLNLPQYTAIDAFMERLSNLPLTYVVVLG